MSLVFLVAEDVPVISGNAILKCYSKGGRDGPADSTPQQMEAGSSSRPLAFCAKMGGMRGKFPMGVWKMKRMVIALAITLAVSVVLANAQDQVKKEAPKPPPSPSQVLLDSWNDIGRKLIAMAEDFPEDKYDFKPNPVERGFAEQLLHAANANYFFINPFIGQKPPEGDPKRDQFKSKAEVVAFVKKSFADGAALIKQKGDSGMSDLGLDPFSKEAQQVRMSDMAWGFIEHDGEHYGQLVVYYRVAGLVPPESRPKK